MVSLIWLIFNILYKEGFLTEGGQSQSSRFDFHQKTYEVHRLCSGSKVNDGDLRFEIKAL